MNDSRASFSVRRIARAIGWLLVLAFLVYMIRVLARDMDTLKEWTVHRSLLAVHVATVALSFAGLLAGWHFVVRAMKPSASTPHTSRAWLLANMGKYVPGKVLMFGGRIELMRKADLRRAETVMAMTLEHVAMLLAAMPLTLYGVLAGLSAPSYWGYAFLGGGAAVALLFALRPLLLIDWLNRILLRFKRAPLERKILRGRFAFSFLIYAISWTLYGWAGWLLVQAMGGALPGLALMVMAVSVAAWTIGFCSFITPGGLGVREAVFAGFLGQYMPVAQALACAAAFRITWTLVEWGGVAIGGVWSAYSRMRV